MTRKYISRKGYDDEPNESLEVRPPLDTTDASDVQARNITFSTTQRPQTPSEIAAAKAQELTSASEDASEYIKEVNSHFNKQITAIDKIKRQKEEFEKEMRLLQGVDETENVPQTAVQKQEQMNDLRNLALKKRLEEQKLALLDKQIAQAKEQLQKYRQTPPAEEKRDAHQSPSFSEAEKQTLAKFLSASLGKKIDPSTLSDALDEINSNTKQ